MSACAVKLLLAAATAVLLSGAQDFRDMTGGWQLDVEKSSWGTANKPLYVMLRIEHHEPVLQYTGLVAFDNEENRRLEFDGRIDGHEYGMMRSYGSGHVVLRRLSANAIVSIFKTDDGRYTEEATTTISADGKKLTRKIHVAGPAIDTDWTEVYRRQ